MEGIYGRRRHLGGVGKFRKCDGISRGIREGNLRERDKKSTNEKTETIESRGKYV